MRVISGKYGSINLNGPDTNKIRPTMDRAKEGIFNVINSDIYDSLFLDLFSGSGSMGIEALSRGAKKVVFIDQNMEAINLIKSNLKIIEKNSVVLKVDAKVYLDNIEEPYDYIFMDPPYDIDMNYVYGCLDIIFDKKLINNGYVILEVASGNKNDELNDKYNVLKTKKYGNSTFYIIGYNV